MASPCLTPLALYRPRNPQASALWRVMDEYFETFRQVYDERFQAKYGFWRAVVEGSVTTFLKCGDLHEGFARVRCPDCHHEMFVAFSCKQRSTCPSCHQKRALLTAIHVAEDVCSPVAHRQVVFTIPKRLRVHTRFDRSLLGKLCSCAWSCLKAEVQRLLGRDDVLPGMVAAIQTHGEPLEFLAEFTQHIPPTGSHLIRYYGWYSNKARGVRRKRQQAAAEAAATALGAGLPTPPIPALQVSPEPPTCSRASQTWAMLIKRVYEVDPLACPKCGGQMKVIAFLEPPQGEVIEKILRHCGLWHASAPRAPPAEDASVHDPDEPRELTYVDIDTFESSFWADF